MVHHFFIIPKQIFQEQLYQYIFKKIVFITFIIFRILNYHRFRICIIRNILAFVVGTAFTCVFWFTLQILWCKRRRTHKFDIFRPHYACVYAWVEVFHAVFFLCFCVLCLRLRSLHKCEPAFKIQSVRHETYVFNYCFSLCNSVLLRARFLHLIYFYD